MPDKPPADFEELSREKRTGLVLELIGFLLAYKKWWLAPIVIAVLLLGLLVLFGGSGAAPFIYTLF